MSLQLGKSSYRDKFIWYNLEKLKRFELGNKCESTFSICI